MPIFFWTGEEDFLINEKIDMWTNAFKEKHGGDINISVLDGIDLEGPEIVSDIESVPFLAEKRLVFIKDLPVQASEKLGDKKSDMILEALDHIDDSNVIVFVQSTPDKRTSFYKKLVKLANVEEFKSLSPASLRSWIQKKIEQKGAKILPSALEHLIQCVGNDLWRLDNEINKLIAYTNKEKPISENDIDNVVYSIITSNVFYFLDAVSVRNKIKALKEFEKILQEGESLMQVFALLINHFRSFVLAHSFPNVNKSILISECKLHPFVAQKILQNMKNFSMDELRSIYKILLDIDEGVKTGRISISSGNEKALALEIEKLVLKL